MTTRSAPLPWRHVTLAVLVVAVWGTNFVVIREALDVLPPMLFATLRFALVALPAIFFLKRPAATWGNLAAYGILIGVGQFGLLYLAMQGHISPGLASLVVQTQVIFTIGLSMLTSGERVRGFQWLAVLLACAGIGLIGLHANGSVTPFGLALVLGAALSWAGGNLVARRNGRINMLAYVVWASPFSLPPLLILSLALEGWPAIAAGLVQAGPGTWAAVLWQSVGNTMFGYALWAWLLARHPAASVSPMALMVPVFGMGASALWLNEPLQPWKLAAAALVLSGLALNFFWPLVAARRTSAGMAAQPSE
ncbi:EamA family transporter [Telmatospirillum siberiense]|uniref:EamA family transporter n=1 Tax=Telmatospirillum siberiense TaxID=382514 RepID=A0A2N3PQH6_9PROT|nr:EamA family transporter [Telmatospirillum siberiense]PKU22665.1 EamA family transporter [Telmatospirillum siberiense]